MYAGLCKEAVEARNVLQQKLAATRADLAAAHAVHPPVSEGPGAFVFLSWR